MLKNRVELGARFERALVYALEVHRDQRRKGSEVPYVGHLLGAASNVIHFGGSEDAAIAALLHDAPEDQGGRARLEEIRRIFGARVAEIVEACTDTLADPRPSWRPRKEAYIAAIAHKDAEMRLVTAADKLDNARAIVADLRTHGSALWGRFTAGSDQLWYYGELVKAFRAAGGGPIVEELAAVVEEMYRLAEAAG